MGAVINPVAGVLGAASGGALNKVGTALWGDNNPIDPRSRMREMARPEDLKFQSLRDEQGNLKDMFKLSSGEGYSDLANQQLAEQVSQAREGVGARGAGSLQTSLSQLASRGGVSEGMRAELARQAMENAMKDQQAVTRTGIEGQQNIGLKQFDIGREAEKANLGNLIGDVKDQRGFDQNMYDMKMKEWAANNTANAQLETANRPKGGVLGGVTQGAGRILGK